MFAWYNKGQFLVKDSYKRIFRLVPAKCFYVYIKQNFGTKLYYIFQKYKKNIMMEFPWFILISFTYFTLLDIASDSKNPKHGVSFAFILHAMN